MVESAAHTANISNHQSIIRNLQCLSSIPWPSHCCCEHLWRQAADRSSRRRQCIRRRSSSRACLHHQVQSEPCSPSFAEGSVYLEKRFFRHSRRQEATGYETSARSLLPVDSAHSRQRPLEHWRPW